MEKKIDGKMKSVASIPENYVSIIELQERWVKEKERKQKEKDLVESGVKQQQVKGQGRREEMNVEVEAIEPSVMLEKKVFGGGFRMNRLEKERNCVYKEEVEVSASVSKKKEDGGDSGARKKKWCKKEKKKKGGSMEEMVKRSVSKACIPREINLVKDEIPRVNVAKGEKIVNAAMDSTQFQDLWIKNTLEEEEARDREVKGPARLNSGQGYYRTHQHDRSSARVIRATGGTMVWVKKGMNDGAPGGGNDV